MRLEPTKLVLIGTRTTYQATGDAGIYICSCKYEKIAKISIIARLPFGEWGVPLMVTQAGMSQIPDDVTSECEVFIVTVGTYLDPFRT